MSRSAARGQTLGELARASGATLRGDAGRMIHEVSALDQAGPASLSFLANPRYKRFLSTTRAAAVILSAEDVDDCPVDCLVGDNPDLVRARVMAVLYAPPPPIPGVHPSTVVGSKVHIDPSAEIAAGCVLGNQVTVGPRVVIGPNCVLLDNVSVGADSRLVASVTLGPDARLGQRCLIHPGAVIGADGFGFAHDAGAWIKVPQIGRVVLGNDVEVGSCSSIDRGAIGDTEIADGVKIDSQVHVAHNVQIGRHTAMAGCAAVAGSARIGAYCTLAGKAGVAGHVELVDHVHVSAATAVIGSINKPGRYTGVAPIMEHSAWTKNFARLRHLDDIVRKVRQLEKELWALQRQIEPNGDATQDAD